MTDPIPVALLGFSPVEREALAAALTLASRRTPRYRPVDAMSEASLVVADADSTDALAQVVRAGLIENAVFFGTHPPPGAEGWLTRPFDAVELLRELDHAAARIGHPPAVAAGAVAAGAVTAAGSTPSAPTPGRAPPPQHALLVDDSEVALRFLETRLHRLGLITERATTGEQALEALAAQRFDFVFLDIELGPDSEFDGLTLCQRLKRHWRSEDPSSPPVVVLVSAHHTELDRARGALAGADAHLAKPLDEAALIDVLERHGASSHPRRGAAR